MKKGLQNALMVLGALCFALLLIEIAGHALARASPLGYGTLFGRELAPLKLIPYCNKQRADNNGSAEYEDLVVDGQKVTVGDLHGLFRDDVVLGYVPREHAVSANAWWQSNNMGARAREDVSVMPEAGRERILVFGESFGAGSRVKQEQTWSAAIGRAMPGSEVLNFAVDGYSMAQAYLRFLRLRNEIGYNFALMMFAPKADLPRDINVFRPLLARSWGPIDILPRYVLERGAFTLVARPYADQADFLAQNCDSVSDKLRSHLARYDRLYFAAEYEQGPPIIGSSVLYKLGVGAYAGSARRRIAQGLMRPGSEALEVSRSIFVHMHEDVMRDGGKFVLILIPLEAELKRLRSAADYRENWNAMADAICAKPLVCIDLAQYLPALSQNRIDRGYDGSHYGPVTNGLIGEFVAHRLAAREALAPGMIGEAPTHAAASERGTEP